MDFSISEIIRDTRAGINTRLDMLEMLIQNARPLPSTSVDTSNIEIMLQLLTSKINSIESKVNDIIESKYDEDLPSLILEDDVIQDNKQVVQEKKEEKMVQEKKEEEVEEEMEEKKEEEVEEEVEEEMEEEVEEEMEEEVEEEMVQEEQELTEFEYKGMILYRDAENKVYQMDEDGELVDTPIGVWNETKQKVLRI
jgi:outer membrane biosynthesis protein TonB